MYFTLLFCVSRPCYYFIYLRLYWVFTVCLSKHSSVFGAWGLLFVVVHRFLLAVASRCRAQGKDLGGVDIWAKLLHGMWDLPKPGREPQSPSLQGGHATTGPPGKPTWGAWKTILMTSSLPGMLTPLMWDWGREGISTLVYIFLLITGHFSSCRNPWTSRLDQTEVLNLGCTLKTPGKLLKTPGKLLKTDESPT